MLLKQNIFLWLGGNHCRKRRKSWIPAFSTNGTKMIISFYNRMDIIAGKGENAGNQHFLLFPTIFSIGFFFESLKPVTVW